MSGETEWGSWRVMLGGLGLTLLILLFMVDGCSESDVPAGPSGPRTAVTAVPYVPAPVWSDRPHAVCRDGSVSYSVSRQGTCSHHGGVSRWVR